MQSTLTPRDRVLRYCGSMCVQTTLAFGSPGEVTREVRLRLGLFPDGGLFLGPTHAIQVGSPLENILALYGTAASLHEVEDSILSVAASGDQTDKVNMSKLF